MATRGVTYPEKGVPVVVDREAEVEEMAAEVEGKVVVQPEGVAALAKGVARGVAKGVAVAKAVVEATQGSFLSQRTSHHIACACVV